MDELISVAIDFPAGGKDEALDFILPRELKDIEERLKIVPGHGRVFHEVIDTRICREMDYEVKFLLDLPKRLLIA